MKVVNIEMIEISLLDLDKKLKKGGDWLLADGCMIPDQTNYDIILRMRDGWCQGSVDKVRPEFKSSETTIGAHLSLKGNWHGCKLRFRKENFDKAFKNFKF